MGDHVFICYSRKDQKFVAKLATNLKSQGVPVWLDQWDIPYGSNYRQEIEKAISSCAKMLLVLSPAAVVSEEVQSEWNKVLNDRKVVIPLLHQTCDIPYRLGVLQRIDFTSRNLDDNTAINDLIVALGMTDRSSLKPAEITTPKVEVPVSATSVANENLIEGGSEVSNMQTFAEKEEVTAFGKLNVYIQDRKYSTIQEAVNAGNPGETIILVAGTYQENLRIDKPFTIKGVGVGKTIIDGCHGGSVIIVGWNRDKIDVTLTGMTIKGGTGTKDRIDPSPIQYACGGGIFNKGKLTINNCIISDNEAYCGGGIFNRGTLNLEKGASVIHNAAHNGGGIYNQGGVRSLALVNLNGCSIEKNQAKELGAGIYSGGNTVNIYSGTTISGNTAGNSGGGVYLAPSKYILNMYGGKIFENHVAASGGGIFSYGGNVHLKGGSIQSNIAMNGAGIENASGGLITLDGAQIFNNIADRNGNGLGGGIHNSGTLIIKNGSIDHNHASKEGGGIKNNELNGKLTGNLALVHDNTLGSDRIPDEIAPLEPLR